MKLKMICALTVYAVAFLASTAYPHCEIPCGIYDDRMRINQIAEHITTLEKSMNEILALTEESDKNYNQLVRWIDNKEFHANELQDIVYQYFMNQRITPVENQESDDYKAYVQQLTLAHNMLVSAMKCKQTTELKHIAKLRDLLARFDAAYFGEQKAAEHGHDH